MSAINKAWMPLRSWGATQGDLFSSTHYNDVAISPRGVHWESQSLSREPSSLGQRSIHQS